MKLDQQLQARDLYIYQGKTQEEIAILLNVSRKTVYNWIKNGQWAEIKLSNQQAPAVVLQDVYNHITEVNKKIAARQYGERCPSMQEVDMLRKLVGITKNYDKGHIGFYVQAYEELTNYILQDNRELAQTVVKYADKYLKGCIFNKNFYSKEEFRATVSNIPPDEPATDIQSAA